MSFNPSQREDHPSQGWSHARTSRARFGQDPCHYGTHQTFDNRIWNQSGKHSCHHVYKSGGNGDEGTFLRLMGGKSSAVTFGTFHAVFL